MFVRLIDQAFQRNTQPGMQVPNHRQGQRPLAIQYFVDTIDPANHWYQILWSKCLLFHIKSDRLNRIREIHRIVFLLIGFRQGDQFSMGRRAGFRRDLGLSRSIPTMGLVLPNIGFRA